jgi:hypothetical protein
MSARSGAALLGLGLALLGLGAPAAAQVFGDVDANGTFGAEDALLLQRHLRNGLALSPAQVAAANVVPEAPGAPPVLDVRDLGVMLRRISCQPAVCIGGAVEPGSLNAGYCEYVPVVTTPHYGTCMGPRVYVDSGHSPFHKIDNSYSGFAKLLLADGYDVRSIRWQKPFNGFPTAAFGDVLVIVTPQSPGFDAFDAQSQEAVRIAEWVKAGGSLLVSLDHPPYNKVGSLAAQFGLVVAGDYSIGDADPFAPGLAAVLGAGIASPLYIDNGTGFHAAPELPDDTALTPIITDPLLPAGTWMGVAVEHGAGRAYFTGDSRIFSTQNVGGLQLSADYERFLRNIMHWLDGSVSP